MIQACIVHLSEPTTVQYRAVQYETVLSDLFTTNHLPNTALVQSRHTVQNAKPFLLLILYNFRHVKDKSRFIDSLYHTAVVLFHYYCNSKVQAPSNFNFFI